MEDLVFNRLFFAVLAISVIIFAIFKLRFKLLHNCRIAAQKSLGAFTERELPFYYSSYALKQECVRKFFRLKPTVYGVLSRAAMKNIKLAAPLIRRKTQTAEQPSDILLLDAQVSLLLNDRERFGHIMQNLALVPLFAPQRLKAQYLYLSAHHEMYLTDMLSASEHCSSALRLYQKLGFMYEEAECFMTLMHIYRISGVQDVAFSMLQEAEKLYKCLHMGAKLAEVQAYFGLIELGRENYAVAAAYLVKAAEIARNYNLTDTRISVYNWLGLAKYLSGKPARAKYYFQKVWTVQATDEARAFATEMLARIYKDEGRYKQALRFAERALAANRRAGNSAGIFESLYLKAEILYVRQEFAESKKILTELIRRKSPPSSIYYPANAYTLLGVINLREENLDIAETLFKQAADLEHGHNRLKGAAIDFNNLAELARMKNMPEEAERYLNQAVEYAEKVNDEKLKAYLLSKRI